MNATEAGIINAGGLDTALAKHYATVLISTLRAIKAASNTVDGAMTGVLDQNAGDGDANEAARN